jgi:hypothetical protein
LEYMSMHHCFIAIWKAFWLNSSRSVTNGIAQTDGEETGSYR